MKQQTRSRGDRHGFTLIELVVTVTIIAILSAVAVPSFYSIIERARVSSAKGQLAQLSVLLKRVHQDSGFWPYENTMWSPLPDCPYPQIEPRPYNSSDTAMMSTTVPPQPTMPGQQPLNLCKNSIPGFPCWAAPYIADGTEMSNLKDPWQNPFMYTYVRPSDGHGGGVASSPNGFVMIWSTGADGIDQTGCSGGGCSVNYTLMAEGKSSIPFCWEAGAVQGSCSDDIVQMVGAAQGQ